MITRDEIIRMAREAQRQNFGTNGGLWFSMEAKDLERFAALIAAAEREACAKVCDDKAKETFSGQCQVWGDYFARAIRARGQK